MSKPCARFVRNFATCGRDELLSTHAVSFSVVALLAVSAGAGAGGTGDWTTFHFDNARTRFTPFENHIKPSNVKFLSL